MRTVAVERKAVMRELMRDNPREAIEQAIGFAEYAALPKEIQVLVEKPFTSKVKLDVYPICGDGVNPLPPGTPDAMRTVRFEDGEEATTFVYGKREEVTSKNASPVTGIVLDGQAVLHEGVFVEVSPEDVAALGLSMPDKSIVTRKPVMEPVYAVAGGEVFAFTDRAEFVAADAQLTKLEQHPGPHSGAIHFFAMAAPADGAAAAGGSHEPYNFENAAAASTIAFSQWTETPKNVFLIRIDASDRPGNPYTQAQVEGEYNGVTNTQIINNSYGKTSIVCTSSANIYRMPQPSTYYSRSGEPDYRTVGSNSGALLTDAKTVFRNTKSGGDAAINIGPLDNSNLGNYDIVGVVFGDFGMLSSGNLYYAGLAGGSNHWIQNNVNSGTCTHELAHNYGIGHSNFWETTDGSVVGAGSSKEYGDPYDIMGGGPVPLGHFNAAHKSKVNWLTPADWVDSTALPNAVHRLYAIDRGTSLQNPRGIRATKVAGTNPEYYWMCYRPTFVSNPFSVNGVHLSWVHGTTDLLDVTPGSLVGKKDAFLAVGRTYSDNTSNVHFTPVATGGVAPNDYIDVRVNIGPFPGNVAPNASSITGPASFAARTAQNFSVSATDSNGDALAYFWDSGNGDLKPSNSGTFAYSFPVGGTYTLKVEISDMKGGVKVLTKTVTVTDPLLTFADHPLPSASNSITRVHWNGKYFVGVSYFGSLWYSMDGNTWNQSTNASSLASPDYGIASNGDVTVFGGNKSGSVAMYFSTDGRVWQTATVPAVTGGITSITWNGTEFLAGSSSGNVFRSTNGQTWTVAAVTGAPQFRRIVWDGSHWFAITNDDKYYNSTNGTTWTFLANAGIDVYEAFAVGSRIFVTGWYGKIRYSDDHGVTWTVAGMPTDDHWTGKQMARADDGTLVCIVSNNSTGVETIVVSQDNGQTWAQPQSPSVAGADGWLAYGAGRFVTGAGNGVSRGSGSFVPTNVVPGAPVITGPSAFAARTSQEFSVSATDGNGDSLVYEWSTGDGRFYPLADHHTLSWAAGGTYTITVRASDLKGGVSINTKNVTVSDPLLTWSQLTMPGSTSGLRAFAYGNHRFVATNYWGDITYSFDGINWVDTPVGVGTDSSLAIAPGIFVAGGSVTGGTGQGGSTTEIRMQWSLDGRIWNAGTSPQTDGILAEIAYGNGKFVALTNLGYVLTSLDGKEWTRSAVAGAPGFDQLTYDGSFWVACTSGNEIYNSPDGINWTKRTNSLGYDIYQIESQNGRLIAGGWYAGLNYSDDHGVTWQHASIPTDNRYTSYDFAHGHDGTWVAVVRGMDAPSFDTILVSSDNGLTWFKPSANQSLPGVKRLVFGAGRFATVGDNGIVRYSAPFDVPNTAPSANFTFPSPANARSTTELEASAMDAEGDALAYYWDFGASEVMDSGQHVFHNYLAGGTFPVTLIVSDNRGGVTQVTQNITVTDPLATANWIQKTVTPPAGGFGGHFFAVAAGGGRIVAAGENQGDTGPIAVSTDNGDTWTGYKMPNNSNPYDLIHDGTQFVAVGARYNFAEPVGFKNWVGTSPDGITWTHRHFGTNSGAVYGVAYNGSGIYLGVASNSVVLRSTDGAVTWTPVASAPVLPAGKHYGKVAYGDGRFVMTSQNDASAAQKIYSSIDGLTWTDETAGLVGGANNVHIGTETEFLNGKFIASGSNSRLRTSAPTNGENGAVHRYDFTTTRPANENVEGITYGNGVYLAVGSVSSSPVNMVSSDGITWSQVTGHGGSDTRRALTFTGDRFVTAGNNRTIWVSAILPDTSGIAGWLAGHFPAGGPNADRLSDADFDGLSNLTEYAFGLIPNQVSVNRNGSGQPLLPYETKTSAGRQAIAFRIPEPSPSDVVYSVYRSSALSSWTLIARKAGAGSWQWLAPGGNQIEISPDAGRSLIRVGLPDANASDPKHFFRLEMTVP